MQSKADWAFRPNIKQPMVENTTCCNYPGSSFFRDKQIQVDMAILDFPKAFDTVTVPHKRLLGKLSFSKGPILRWIEAFLVDGIQGVVVEGCRYS